MISNLRRAGDSLFEQKRRLLEDMVASSGVGSDRLDQRPVNDKCPKQCLSQTLDVVEQAESDREDLQLSQFGPRESRQNRVSVLRVSQDDDAASPFMNGALSPVPLGSTRLDSGLELIDQPRYGASGAKSKPYSPASSLMTKDATKGARLQV